MMKLETDWGTFEGTEQEIRKASAKAKVKYERKRKIDAENRKVATTRAKAQAYDIMQWKLNDECPHDGFPRAWSFRSIDEKYSPIEYVPGPHSRSCSVWISTYDGRVLNDFYSYRVLGCIENGSGFAIAIVIEDRDNPGPKLYAVGIHEGTFAMTQIYGIELKEFHVRKG